MTRKTRYKLILFDLDGTLIDSRRDISVATNYALKRLNLPTLSEKKIWLFVGSGLNTLIQKSLESAALPVTTRAILTARAHFEKFYLKHCLDNTRWYPHVVTTLKGLAKTHPLGIFTNKPQNFAERIIRGLKGRPYFKTMIAASRNGTAKKPDPSAALSLIKKWDITPGEVLLVGDSLIDFQTSLNGGFDFALVDHGFSGIPKRAAQKIRWRFAGFQGFRRWIQEELPPNRTRTPSSREHQ